MNWRFIFLLILFVSCSVIKKQTTGSAKITNNSNKSGPQNLNEFAAFVDSFINAQIKKANIPGAAFVFVKDGKIFYSKGYGLANVEKNIEVDPAKTIFRIGSISKVFTADALLQLADKGLLDLNRDVNSYLKTIKVPSSFPKPITASHILTHTTGLDEIRPGTQAAEAAGILPLNDFLETKLVRLWSPGEIVMYSTYGITLGGLVVEDISGKPFESYLATNIWEPLQMRSTCITVPAALENKVAMGYESSQGINVPQNWEWYHTAPASSINSTAEDMAHWLIAHLNDGAYSNNSIMSKSMMNEMTKHQFSMHPAMYGMAYGFFEEYYKDIRFLHHGGNVAGFNSLAVLIPTMNAGFFFVSQHESSSIRENLQWAILVKYYNTSSAPSKPVNSTQNSERAKIFAGRYKYNCYCHTCNVQPQTMTFNVSANTDGTIQVNGRKWIETQENLFVREDGESKISFRTDSSGKITHMYFGGYWAFEKE
jgi:CubicO group peptidase (beta-lactamase class C family)